MLSLLLFAQVAASAAPACPTALPLAKWLQALPATRLTLDRSTLLAAVTLPPANPKETGKVAVAAFTIARRGTYTIAYGAKGWVDVMAAGGTSLASIAHGHSGCGGGMKLVAFALAPGTYRLRGDGITGTDVRVALLSGDQTKGPAQ